MNIAFNGAQHVIAVPELVYRSSHAGVKRVDAAARGAALGRAVLPQHPASAALRDPESVTDMIDALAPTRGAWMGYSGLRSRRR